MSVKVIDDLLTEEEFQQVFDFAVNDKRNGWALSVAIESKYLNDESNETPQFVKMLYTDMELYASPDIDKLNTLFDKLNVYKLFRCKVNAVGRGDKILETGYHVDLGGLEYDNIKVAVFYLNTNDGYTAIKEYGKVESVRNRAVILDNKTLHSGTNTTDTDYRFAINIAYMEKNAEVFLEGEKY